MSKKTPEQASVYDVIKLLDVASHAGYVQKKFKLAGATTDVEARRSSAVSTGLLMTDVMLNGGIYPGGWYTFFGPEQSGKSTHMLGVMASLFYSNVPLVVYFDSEGSSSAEYIEAIAQTSNVNRDIDIKKVFGIRNPNRKNKKDPEWVIEPRIWYYPENSLESFYKSVSAILRRLPDKVNLDGEWWLLFDRTKENISRFKGQHDTKVGDQYGKLAVRAPDGAAMQALIIVDSYPALVTDSDDDDDGDNSLGVNARGHSKHINKVKGKLKRKHATVLGVNQLRDAINIGNPYGPKEYEPGGNALRYSSDCRISQRPRSVPHGSGQIEEEDTVLHRGGVDTYRYICMKAIKNKFGSAFLESWYRIWISDPKGQGHGFCPVYDTYRYLLATGQLSGSINKKLNIYIEGDQYEGLTWLDFKCLILLQGQELKEFCKELNIKKNPLIRERCFDQIRSGRGIDMFYKVLHGNEDEQIDEIDVPYEEWKKIDLIAEVVDRKLIKKRDARKMKEIDLIKELYSDDGESYHEEDSED